MGLIIPQENHPKMSFRQVDFFDFFSVSFCRFLSPRKSWKMWLAINEFLPVSPIPKEVLESQPSRTDDPSSLVSVEVRPMKSDEADEAGAPHKTKHGNVIYIYMICIYIYI